MTVGIDESARKKSKLCSQTWPKMLEYVGRVTKHPFAVGSKSEHEAVFLETGEKRFVLRRVGGNPFYDPELDRLVGKTIRCHGQVAGYALLVSDWTECPAE